MGKQHVVKDMVGYEFNGCIVLERAENSKDNRAKWTCKCFCGTIFTSVGRDIRNGKIVSCGCRKRSVSYKHGEARTRLYSIWSGIKSRCRNEKDTSYKNYGKRGINVCDDWYNDFF